MAAAMGNINGSRVLGASNGHIVATAAAATMLYPCFSPFLCTGGSTQYVPERGLNKYGAYIATADCCSYIQMHSMVLLGMYLVLLSPTFLVSSLNTVWQALL